MQLFFKSLMPAWLTLVLACTSAVNAAPSGFVEGHLTIISPKEVELADGNAPAIPAEPYAEYPLNILPRDVKKEIARVTADGDGNYRAALPPGDYILDAQGRARGHIRAKPRRFKVASRQTARVDMQIDTGVR
jgi:hypothetical protein